MIVTRFAPSPTGRLHLGHAFSAALGASRARESGGKFLLRIEDLDQGRSRPEFVDGIFEDLHWLGLDWDEPVAGPVAANARLCRRAGHASRTGPRLCLLLHARRYRPVADGAARRCGDILSGHLPPLARRSGAPRDDAALLAAGLRQGAGARRACLVDGSRRKRFRAREAARSATPSSPGRTRPRAITLPASSTMRRAE